MNAICERLGRSVPGVLGDYSMIAMVINVARTEIPEGKPFPLAPLQAYVLRG
jgi:hypothetical protein